MCQGKLFRILIPQHTRMFFKDWPIKINLYKWERERAVVCCITVSSSSQQAVEGCWTRDLPPCWGGSTSWCRHCHLGSHWGCLADFLLDSETTHAWDMKITTRTLKQDMQKILNSFATKPVTVLTLGTTTSSSLSSYARWTCLLPSWRRLSSSAPRGCHRACPQKRRFRPCVLPHSIM